MGILSTRCILFSANIISLLIVSEFKLLIETSKADPQPFRVHFSFKSRI